MALKAGSQALGREIMASLKGQGSRSKYRAVATVVDGLRFDSRKEAKRWGELQLLQRAGKIAHLIRQPRYGLFILPMLGTDRVHVGDYVGDFQYVDASGVKVIEDVKSQPTKTPLYRLKKKIVEALYDIRITEV